MSQSTDSHHVLMACLGSSLFWRLFDSDCIMSAGSKSGQPWCSCGRTLLANMSPHLRENWKILEFTCWSWTSENQAYWHSACVGHAFQRSLLLPALAPVGIPPMTSRTLLPKAWGPVKTPPHLGQAVPRALLIM